MTRSGRYSGRLTRHRSDGVKASARKSNVNSEKKKGFSRFGFRDIFDVEGMQLFEKQSCFLRVKAGIDG